MVTLHLDLDDLLDPQVPDRLHHEGAKEHHLPHALAVGAAGRVSADLMVPAALLTFTLKMAVIGMLLFLLWDTTAFDREVFALSLVAGTCVYLAAEVRFAVRARTPYVVTDEKKPGPR
mgnify:CR=1 FL=1